MRAPCCVVWVSWSKRSLLLPTLRRCVFATSLSHPIKETELKECWWSDRFSMTFKIPYSIYSLARHAKITAAWNSFVYLKTRNLYPTQSTRQWDGRRMWRVWGDSKGVYGVSVGTTDGKRLLGRPKPRRENVIKMDFQEVGWGIGTELLWLRIGAGGGRLWMR